MFDVGWDEMALIAVVSLIVIGPKDLPVVLRHIGRFTRKARQMAAEFQSGLDDIVRDSELADIKKQVQTVTDPNQLRLEVEKAIDPTGELARQVELPPLDEVGKPESQPEVVPEALPLENPPKPPEP